MKRVLFILASVIILISINFISAEVNPCGNENSFLGYSIKSTNITLTQTCENCTYINVTSLKYPNSTVKAINSAMTKDGVDYSYSLHQNFTPVSGCYSYNTCGDKDGDFKCEVIDFEVNPIGIAPSESRTASVSRAVYFPAIIAILCFLGFLFVKTKPPIKWTFFIFSIFFFVMTLNFLFLGLQDEVVNPVIENFFSSFLAISFYIYWFLAGVLILMWFISFLITWFYKQNENKMSKFGYK